MFERKLLVLKEYEHNSLKIEERINNDLTKMKREIGPNQ